jgi:hypothetical protein
MKKLETVNVGSTLRVPPSQDFTGPWQQNTKLKQ